LEHLGARKGTTYQFKVLAPLSMIEDPRAHVLRIIDGDGFPETEFRRDLELARASWIGLKARRKEFLKTLSLFELSKAQVERVANSESRRAAGGVEYEQRLCSSHCFV